MAARLEIESADRDSTLDNNNVDSAGRSRTFIDDQASHARSR